MSHQLAEAPPVIEAGDQFVHVRYLTVRVVVSVTSQRVYHISTEEWDAGRRSTRGAARFPADEIPQNVRFWLWH